MLDVDVCGVPSSDRMPVSSRAWALQPFTEVTSSMVLIKHPLWAVHNRRMLLVDLGAFVLINVYVPNAGCRRSGGAGGDSSVRVDLKERFLAALLEKAHGLVSAGREVHACMSAIMRRSCPRVASSTALVYRHT